MNNNLLNTIVKLFKSANTEHRELAATIYINSNPTDDDIEELNSKLMGDPIGDKRFDMLAKILLESSKKEVNIL